MFIILPAKFGFLHHNINNEMIFEYKNLTFQYFFLNFAMQMKG